jgi:hypothetical protein
MTRDNACKGPDSLKGFQHPDDAELLHTVGGNKVRVDAQGNELGCTEVGPVKGHWPPPPVRYAR